MYFIFLPHLTSASALPGETGNCIFSLKCCMLFHQKNTKRSLKCHLLRAEPPFSVKTFERSTGCTRQGLGREPQHSMLLSVTHMLCVNQVCHGVSRRVKRWQFFFVKPGVKVNGQYLNGIPYYLNKC